MNELIARLRGNAGVADCLDAADALERLQADLAAANARVEELGRHIKEVESENSKLRSALEIIHFKREPWQ